MLHRGWARLGVSLLLATLVLAEGSRAWEFARLRQSAYSRYGNDGAERVMLWEQMLSETRSLSEADRLKKVNDWVNRKIQFVDDIELWQQVDYWATPIEFLGRGAGDCEDFSIAKYFSLKASGVPIERLRLTYVRARIGGPDSKISQAHMVLTYYPSPDAEPLVLDNLLNEIRPAGRRPDLTPIFSFNSDGIWAGGQRSNQSVDRLSRWKNLTDRMRTEGFVD